LEIGNPPQLIQLPTSFSTTLPNIKWPLTDTTSTNRLLSRPLTIERQQAEWETMVTIARNNNFPTKLITNLKTQMQHKTQGTIIKEKNKWAVFTFYSPKIRKLTNLFRQTNIHIAFKSTNTIQQYTKPKKPDENCEYNMSGIYKLAGKTCERSYIEQISKNLT